MIRVGYQCVNILVDAVKTKAHEIKVYREREWDELKVF